MKRSATAHPFVAGDGSLLREILHPGKEPVDIRFSLAHATVRPAQRTFPHILDCAEVYYVLSGTGVMHIGSETQTVARGDTVYIPAGHCQSIENNGQEDLSFLCIVDPAWRPEIEKIVDRE